MMVGQQVQNAGGSSPVCPLAFIPWELQGKTPAPIWALWAAPQIHTEGFGFPKVPLGAVQQQPSS